MTEILILFALAIPVVLIIAIKNALASGDRMHCMTCGSERETHTRTRGSIFIEIILWLCFIVPGLIYSIWRLTTKERVCGACGATNVVPLDTPAAAAHRKALTQG